jgi:hypothetical protein
VNPQQTVLLSFPPRPDGSVFVSDRVSFRTVGAQRVISVQGVLFAHYSVEDRAAEAYAMIVLCESGYATQIQIAGLSVTPSGVCVVTRSAFKPAASARWCGDQDGLWAAFPNTQKNGGVTKRFCT